MLIERVGVCGLGKVGSVIHKVFTDAGFPTVGHDVDDTRSQASISELVEASDACIFIVPTPSLPDGTFDNQYLIDAITKVSEQVRKLKRYDYVFIVSSTTAPGSCEHVFKPLLPPGAGLVYKPEFIAQGSIEEDLKHPDLVLIGEFTPWAGHAAEALYSQIVRSAVSIRHMSLTEAELAKIAVNCAVTQKISFANQVGLVADAMGCDAHKILEAVGCDSRIGSKYLHPGLPFGGPCFPRDNRMFRAVAQKNRIYAMPAMATDLMNEEVKNRILHRLSGGNTPVGILGLAYKPGTDITEESLGMWLCEKFSDFVREYRAWDPLAESPNTLEEVLACPMVVIANPDPTFKTLEFPPTCEVIDPWGLL